MEEKTYVDDIDRSIYDIKNDEKDVYRIQEGLTPEKGSFLDGNFQAAVPADI